MRRIAKLMLMLSVISVASAVSAGPEGEPDWIGSLQTRISRLSEVLQPGKHGDPTLAEIVGQMQEFVTRSSKSKLRLPIFLSPAVAGLTWERPKPHESPTLDGDVGEMREISVLDTLRYICDLSGAKFAITKEGVLIWHEKEQSRYQGLKNQLLR